MTPDPEWLDYPTLLDLPRPRLRAYRRETAIAEKVHAMVVLGRNNSRMKDFFDIHALAMRKPFDGPPLADALRATFDRRRTEIPKQLPITFTPAFAQVEGKRAQWVGFVRRSRSTTAPPALDEVIEKLREFAEPILAAAGAECRYAHRWAPGGPWLPTKESHP